VSCAAGRAKPRYCTMSAMAQTHCSIGLRLTSGVTLIADQITDITRIIITRGLPQIYEQALYRSPGAVKNSSP